MAVNMNPMVPEEVNVFKVPHMRMKGLVNDYSDMLEITNFWNRHAVDHLLATLEQTFHEFATHERIENNLIMNRLRLKMSTNRLKRNADLCNNHKDSQLNSILRIVQDGFKQRSSQSLISYGEMLRLKLKDFSSAFIPHMQQEEDVFQPLLQEVFSYEELCDLKRHVMEEHLLCSCKPASLSKRIKPDYDTLREEEEDPPLDCRGDEDDYYCPNLLSRYSNDALPDELLLKIFRKLNVRDLCRARRVCRSWSRVAGTDDLFSCIMPVEWSNGNWSKHYSDIDIKVVKAISDEDMLLGKDDDLDNDIIGSLNSQNDSESLIIRSLVKYFLPRIGHKVKLLNLSYSQYISNGILHRILLFCPNLEELYIDYTTIGDLAFKSIIRKGSCVNLRRISFAGCSNLSDSTMKSLANGMCQLDCTEKKSKLEYLNLSGCYQITDYGLNTLMAIYHPNLKYADLSGLRMLTTSSLQLLLSRCPDLSAEYLWFCDNVLTEDISILSLANGCANLECLNRFCCRYAS